MQRKLVPGEIYIVWTKNHEYFHYGQQVRDAGKYEVLSLGVYMISAHEPQGEAAFVKREHLWHPDDGYVNGTCFEDSK